MGNALTTFDFNSNSLRVIDIEGEPWFVAQDVCRVLALAIDRKTGNVCFTPKRFTTLVADEVALHPVQVNLSDGRVQNRRMHLLAESGLYKLIMRSDKSEARAFQDWVTRVVLPAIRKDGAYIAGEEKLAAGELSEDSPCFWGQISERLTIYT